MKHLAPTKLTCAICAIALLAALLVVGTGSAGASVTGGASFQPPPPPPKRAKIVNGKAIAPANAPWRVRRIIRAGNRIIGKPYKWGGGHATFSRVDSGYDCSGSVSYALRGGRLLRSPLTSGALMSWGRRGPGRWVTVYAHGGHTYMVVAGLRLDTSMRDDPSRTGPGWSRRLRRNDAFVARHPRGL
jgi:cell wall-associated NlpC family hydrolase